MTSKHTPGPWEAWNQHESPDAYYGHYRIDAEDAEIASVHNAGPATACNARLLAKAPELVEAVRDLLLDTGRAGAFARERARALLAEIDG